MTPGLYAVVDDVAHADYGLERLLNDIVLESRIPVVQIRLKKMMTEQKLKLIDVAVALKRRRDFTLVINDDFSLLATPGVDMVHLGQEDLMHAHGLQPHQMGLSTHSVAQALNAEERGVKYIGCGTLFKTYNKRNTVLIGLKGLRDIVESVQIPTVAIGGISADNIAAVALTECHMAAVISALTLNNHFQGQRLHEEFLKNSPHSLRA